jgi:hypothetical protein
MAEHGQTSPRGVAVVAVSLAAARRALGIGHILTEQVVGRRTEQQMPRKVAVQERNHVAARPQRHGKAGRRGLVAITHRHGPFHVAFLEQFQEPLFHAAREEHERIGHCQEIRLRKPLRKSHDFGNRSTTGVNPRQNINAGQIDRRAVAGLDSRHVPMGCRCTGLLRILRQSQWCGLFWGCG